MNTICAFLNVCFFTEGAKRWTFEIRTVGKCASLLILLELHIQFLIGSRERVIQQGTGFKLLLLFKGNQVVKADYSFHGLWCHLSKTLNQNHLTPIQRVESRGRRDVYFCSSFVKSIDNFITQHSQCLTCGFDLRTEKRLLKKLNWRGIWILESLFIISSMQFLFASLLWDKTLERNLDFSTRIHPTNCST